MDRFRLLSFRQYLKQKIHGVQRGEKKKKKGGGGGGGVEKREVERHIKQSEKGETERTKDRRR